MIKELKRQVMDEFFPEEVYVIEEDVIDLITSSKVSVSQSDYGSNLDLSTAFVVLMNVASFIDNVLNIITFFKEKGNQNPNPEEIISNLPENYTHTIDNQKTIEIIYYIKSKI